MDKMIKYAGMQQVKSVDRDNRIIEFIASKEIPDYDGDIVKIDGLDISKIKKNKSFLWSHQQTALPIGKLIRVWKDGNLLKGKAQLTSEEENSFGYSVYKLIAGGFINNISISFMPDWDEVSHNEDKKTGKRTTIFNKSTLLEISAVNIGANAGTSIETKSLEECINDAWESGDIDGLELNALNDTLVKEVETKEMNYEAEITKLKDEMDKLKDGSYLYSIFDREEHEDNSLDKIYDSLMLEKATEDEEQKSMIQEAIDALKDK